MTKKREKAPAVPTITREQAEETLSEYAKADAELEQLTAEMDQRMTEIRELYADRIGRLTANKEEKFTTLQLYAVQHKDNLFTDRRSVDYLHGTLGFRYGNFKVITKKGVTFKAAVNMMLNVPFLKKNFLVTKNELNKEAIIAVREDKKAMAKLNAVGLEVDQEENFFIELKKEGVES